MAKRSAGKSFNDAYASLVSDIGNKTATLKTSSTTQSNVVTQLSNQQQSISGVNLDEEYGNLQRFQQYYPPMHRFCRRRMPFLMR